MFLLRYFVEGHGPILRTFCFELATYKGKELLTNYWSIISQVSFGSKSIDEILMELGHALKVSRKDVTHVIMYLAYNFKYLLGL